MARKWQKTAIFFIAFQLFFFTFFIDCSHIYVPNGVFGGSTSRPHLGDLVMSLFFTLGSTVHDKGWPKNGPFLTKSGKKWQACQRSKVIQKGPKGTKMVNLSDLDPLGPIWTLLDHFKKKSLSTSAKHYFVHLGQKIHFFLKWSNRVQMGPKWSQIVKNT